MAVRSTNTYIEALQSLLQDVASMQALPDANLEWLKAVQDAILAEVQAPLRAQAQAAAAPPTSAAPLPPGAGAGPPPAGMAALLGAGGPGNGSAPLPPSPAGDDLRRMMA